MNGNDDKFWNNPKNIPQLTSDDLRYPPESAPESAPKPDVITGGYVIEATDDQGLLVHKIGATTITSAANAYETMVADWKYGFDPETARIELRTANGLIIEATNRADWS